MIISSQPAYSAMIISSQRAYSAVTAAHTCRRNRLSRVVGADLQITFVEDRDPLTRGWRRLADHLRAAGSGENLSASRSRPGCWRRESKKRRPMVLPAHSVVHLARHDGLELLKVLRISTPTPW